MNRFAWGVVCGAAITLLALAGRRIVRDAIVTGAAWDAAAQQARAAGEATRTAAHGE